MANIVITKSGNSIIVDFGVYATHIKIGTLKRSYHVGNLTEVDLMDDHVEVYMAVTHETFKLTDDQAYTGDEFFIVDTIDGMAPDDLPDLFNDISALR